MQLNNLNSAGLNQIYQLITFKSTKYALTFFFFNKKVKSKRRNLGGLYCDEIKVFSY